MRELSNEELITKAKNGDVKAYNKFFEKNVNMARFVANKYLSTGIEPDELFGVATEGMLKAYNSFEVSKGFKFMTYATRCMHNQILMYLRKHKNDKTVMSLDEPIATDGDGNTRTLGDALPGDFIDPLESIEEEESRHRIREAVLKLPEKYRTAIELLYFKRKTQREISEIMGLSQSYVSRIEKKALVALRKLYDKEKGSVYVMRTIDLGRLTYILDNYLGDEEVSFTSIADAVGVTKGVISYHINKYRSGDYANVERIPCPKPIRTTKRRKSVKQEIPKIPDLYKVSEDTVSKLTEPLVEERGEEIMENQSIVVPTEHTKAKTGDIVLSLKGANYKSVSLTLETIIAIINTEDVFNLDITLSKAE